MCRMEMDVKLKRRLNILNDEDKEVFILVHDPEHYFVQEREHKIISTTTYCLRTNKGNLAKFKTV